MPTSTSPTSSVPPPSPTFPKLAILFPSYSIRHSSFIPLPALAIHLSPLLAIASLDPISPTDAMRLCYPSQHFPSTSCGSFLPSVSSPSQRLPSLCVIPLSSHPSRLPHQLPLTAFNIHFSSHSRHLPCTLLIPRGICQPSFCLSQLLHFIIFSSGATAFHLPCLSQKFRSIFSSQNNYISPFPLSSNCIQSFSLVAFPPAYLLQYLNRTAVLHIFSSTLTVLV